MGILSSILGKGSDLLFGTKDQTKKLETYTPEQQRQLSSLLSLLSPEGALGQGYGQSLGRLQEMLDPNSAAQQRFTAPYMQQFQEQTVPQLAERFAGAGGGALSSSGFGQALSSAAGGLQSNLAQLKGQLQQQAIQDILGQYQNLSQMGLGAKPFGYQHIQGSPGLLGYAAKGYGKAGFPGLFSNNQMNQELLGNAGPQGVV